MSVPPPLHRYARQITLPEVGVAGQARLAAARVLIVGAGGLGSPVAMYLAAAGVGQIVLADGDEVQESNLHRQLLYSAADVGKPKVEAALARLHAINPGVQLAGVAANVTPPNALELVRAADVVVDGTDNFPSRYLLSDACVIEQKPLVHGSVSRFDGQLTMLVAEGAPCYRCLFREPPAPGTVPNCAEAGVLGVLPGLIGVAQATAVLNLVLGIGSTLAGRLLLLDGKTLAWQEIAVARDPDCPACGARRALSSLGDLGPYDVVECTPPGARAPGELSPLEARSRLDAGWAPVLLDVREQWEWDIARLPGATLIPMSGVPGARAQLDPGREYLVYCHHGVRSAAVAAWLRDHGFDRVTNLAGGIDRWSVEVEPSVPRY